MSDARDDAFSRAWSRLLQDHCTPVVVRALERGGDHRPLWSTLEASGFLDALRPESQGGAGLSLPDALPLFEAEGRHALPLPAGATMLVRAALARAGHAVPDGPIAIAESFVEGAQGSLQAVGVEAGRWVDWVAVPKGRSWMLLPVASAECLPDGIHGSTRADLLWPAMPRDALHVKQPNGGWQEAGAALVAAQLAGGMQQVLDGTLAFVNQREQFGRSIGQFQAVQHQLAVMAEQVMASRMAAAIGCSDAVDGLWPQPLRAAVAKARASEAAALVATMAHALHGAIGVTAELDLQLFTRRLHAGRAAFGAEGHWNRLIGAAVLADDTRTTLDFMRQRLLPQSLPAPT